MKKSISLFISLFFIVMVIGSCSQSNQLVQKNDASYGTSDFESSSKESYIKDIEAKSEEIKLEEIRKNGVSKKSSSFQSSSSQAVSSVFVSSSSVSSALTSSNVISSSSAVPSSSSSVSSGVITPPTVSDKLIWGFTTKYYVGDLSSYNSMVKSPTLLNNIAVFAYQTDGSGFISGIDAPEQVSFANSNNIVPLALITNSLGNGFSKEVATALLTNSANKQAFINNLITLLKAKGYKGVNIDFEDIPYTLRSSYTAFLSDLKASLSSVGLLTTIAVPAKTVDNPLNSWNGAFDYVEIGKIVDLVVLMTYDEHGPWSTAGAVSSYDFVNNTVKYAVSVMPKTKIIMGLPAYGYEWSSAGNKAYSLPQIDTIMQNNVGTAFFDNILEAPSFTYISGGIVKTIWYENYNSIMAKLSIAKTYDIKGVAIWRMGLENNEFLRAINTYKP